MIIDDPKLKNLYFNSAENYLKILDQSFLKLEKDPNDLTLVSEAFRAAHSFKSESLTMGLKNLGELCHALEEVLDVLQSFGPKITSQDISQMLAALDDLKKNLDQVKKKGEELDLQERIEKVRNLANQLKTSKRGTKDKKVSPQKDEIEEERFKIRTPESISVKTEILDSLMNLIEEFIILKMKLDKIPQVKEDKELKEFRKRFELLLSELQYYISQSRLIPIGEIFGALPRVARDIANLQNKNVDLEIEGSDLKMDRTIADRLSEPLVHLLKNAVDHGIETKEERKSKGKPLTGKIKLRAYRQKERAVIEVSDDGAGFDFAKIRKTLKEKTNLQEGEIEKLKDDELLELLFKGGVSTRAEVTSYSGRGIGLFAVRSAIDFLGGNLKFDSQPNQGTRFSLEFPLSLAVIKALMVRIEDEVFAIPVRNVIKSIQLTEKEIQKAADLETFIFEEEEIAILNLKERFEIFPPEEGQLFKSLILVGYEQEKMGFLVSQALGLEEITVKPLPQSFIGKDFSGATILGDGRVALIVDVVSIFNDIKKEQE